MEELHQIEQSGFRRDGNNIYLPISFDAAKLAEGLKEGNLAEALIPIARAAEALQNVQPSFQRLRDAIVAKAKGTGRSEIICRESIPGLWQEFA